MERLITYLRSMEPVLWLCSGDQARAKSIAVQSASTSFLRLVCLEWSLSKGTVVHKGPPDLDRYISQFKNCSDPYSFFTKAYKVLSKQGGVSTKYDSNHYIVFLVPVDYLIRSEAQGPDPLLLQLVEDLRQVRSLRGTMILLGNTEPALGVPQLLADIPRIVLGPPGPSEIKSKFVRPLVQTGDISRTLTNEVTYSLFGCESPVIQSILSRALVRKDNNDILEYCRNERSLKMSEGLSGILEPVINEQITSESCIGVSESFAHWIEVRRNHFKSGSSVNISSSKGLYLTGWPGFGKSHLAKYILNKLEAPVSFQLRLHSILRKYLGEAESILQKALNIVTTLAKEGVLVGLICDEADKFFNTGGMSGTSDEGSSAVLNRILSILLQFISENEYPFFFIFCGNTLNVPLEIIRAGRISQIACIGPYSSRAQREIYGYYLNKLGLECNVEDLHIALSDDDKFSPAELRSAAEYIYLEQNGNESPITLSGLRESINRITPIIELIGEEQIQNSLDAARGRNFMIVNDDANSLKSTTQRAELYEDNLIHIYRDKFTRQANEEA
jgi:hypothetical protein